MTIVITVISGFLVFVSGQFFLKLVLDPIVSFKESLGLLSAFCLQHRAKITNANASLDESNELRAIISTILSKKQSIPFYSKISDLLKLPTEIDLLKGCRNLNLVASEMCVETPHPRDNSLGCIKILLELQNTSELLGIRLDFEKL